MLKTIDEMLLKFAALMDDFPVVAPEPPKPEELSSIPSSLPIDSEKLSPKPIEIGEKTENEPEPGSAEWAAKYHTQEFLRGVKQPYRGWIRNPANAEIVKKTMDELVEKRPGDYFSWDLNRRQELMPWLYPAAASLIKKDPLMALMKEIYRFKELSDLQTELWKAVLDREISASARVPQSAGHVLMNTIFNKMRHLAGLIAATDPEFYWLYIEGKPITTKQFDEEAKRMLKQKQELGKSKPISLRHKTKL